LKIIFHSGKRNVAQQNKIAILKKNKHFFSYLLPIVKKKWYLCIIVLFRLGKNRFSHIQIDEKDKTELF
jgi:DNA-binding HxlR family transcriptional regulator